MFLASVLACATLESTTCVVVANEANLWYTREKCEADAVKMAGIIIINGYYAVPKCFKVGDNA
jgi:hypothetical protein